MKTLVLALLAGLLTLPAMAEGPHDTDATEAAEEHGTSERPQDATKTLEDDVLSKLDDPELLEVLKTDIDELQRLQIYERLGIQVRSSKNGTELTTPDP